MLAAALRQDDGVFRDCTISGCGSYRYWLGQSWGHAPKGYPTITFVMHNPSTADAASDDPTMESCRRIARHKGFLSLSVVNAMAFRARFPSDLLQAEDPQGPSNMLAVQSVLRATTGPIVCAWGQIHKKLRRHELALVSLLSDPEFAGRLVALKLAKDGRPYHPLYQSPGARLAPMRLVVLKDLGKVGGYRLVPIEEEKNDPS